MYESFFDMNICSLAHHFGRIETTDGTITHHYHPAIDIDGGAVSWMSLLSDNRSIVSQSNAPSQHTLSPSPKQPITHTLTY